MRCSYPSAIGSILFFAVPGIAQTLPIVQDVPWEPLRQQCRRLLDAFAMNKTPFPAETERALRAILDQPPKAADAAVQELLDPLCLAGVHINPESRVKVARGPASAILTRDRAAWFLVKVQNDAGVTHGFAISGPQVIENKASSGNGTWLEATVIGTPPKLLGQRLEYVLLKLTPRATGKREATLRFDVGQGSQDLGFRAEVPVLFSVRQR